MITDKKSRSCKQSKSGAELVQIFWAAPMEARFSEDTIAAVTQRTIKTLQCDRWRKAGIPFSKIVGRVLYKKADVISWLDSFSVCTNTSQYASKEGQNHVA